MPMRLILGIQAVSGSNNDISDFADEWRTGEIGYEHMGVIKSAQIEQDQNKPNIIVQAEFITQKNKEKEIKQDQDIHEKEEEKHTCEEKQRMSRIDKGRRE